MLNLFPIFVSETKNLNESKKIRILEKHLYEIEILNKNEINRRSRIKSKGDSIMACTSIISGVIIAMSIFIQKEAQINKEWLIVFASLTLLLAFSIAITIFYVYKINTKDNISVLGPSDLSSNKFNSIIDYLQHLIELNNKIFESNKDNINKKVSYMLSANLWILVTCSLFVIYTLLLLIWVCVR